MSMADGLNPQIVTAVEEVSAKAFALKKIAHVGVYDTLVSIKQQADREKEETEKRKTNMGTRNNSATDMTSMNDKEEDDEKIPEDTADPNKVKVTMEQKEMLLSSYSAVALQMDSLWNSISDYFETNAVVPCAVPEKLPAPMDQILSTDVPKKDLNEYEFRPVEEVPEDVMTDEEAAEMENLMGESALAIDYVLENIVHPSIEKLEKEMKANKNKLKKMHTDALNRAIDDATKKVEEDIASKKRARDSSS